MRHLAILVLFLAILASPAFGKVVWNDDGFVLETAGWMDEPMFRDWTGVKMGMSIPPGGYVVLEGKGALELFLPCKGWVADVGITVIQGCEPSLLTGRDSSAFHSLVITEGQGCSKQGGRVLLLVRIPKLFPTDHCKPVELRWRKGWYDVQE